MLMRPSPTVLPTVALLAAAALQAQETPGGAPRRDLVAAADPMSGTWGVDFASSYYLRGFLQAADGAITQPHLQLAYDLGRLDDTSVKATFGVWNALIGGTNGESIPNTSLWYESDFYFGIDVDLASRIEVGATYTSYDWPNSTVQAVREFALDIALDDSDLLGIGRRGLRPSLLVAFDLEGQIDTGDRRGTYLQAGVAPDFCLFTLGDIEVEVALPMRIGCSLGGYYEDSLGADHRFGYADVGAEFSTQLRFLPDRIGFWSTSFGVHVLFLGDATAERNNGERVAVVASVGLSTTF